MITNTASFNGILIDEAVQRLLNCAAALNASVAKTAVRDDLAEQLKAAVRAKLGSRSHSSVVAECAPDESFGGQLKAAVKAKLALRGYIAHSENV